MIFFQNRITILISVCVSPCFEMKKEIADKLKWKVSHCY